MSAATRRMNTRVRNKLAPKVEGPIDMTVAQTSASFTPNASVPKPRGRKHPHHAAFTTPRASRDSRRG